MTANHAELGKSRGAYRCECGYSSGTAAGVRRHIGLTARYANPATPHPKRRPTTTVEAGLGLPNSGPVGEAPEVYAERYPVAEAVLAEAANGAEPEALAELARRAIEVGAARTDIGELGRVGYLVAMPAPLFTALGEHASGYYGRNLGDPEAWQELAAWHAASEARATLERRRPGGPPRQPWTSAGAPRGTDSGD